MHKITHKEILIFASAFWFVRNLFIFLQLFWFVLPIGLNIGFRLEIANRLDG